MMIKKALHIVSLLSWPIRVIIIGVASVVSLVFLVILSVLSLGILEQLFINSNLFAGIAYPKTMFEFYAIYEEGKRPPDSAPDRLNAGAAYPQMIYIIIYRNSQFKVDFHTTIFVNKPYKVLHMTEMSYEWEDNTGIFLKERCIELREDRYVYQDGWYWLGNTYLLELNAEKLFKGKKMGDEFKFRLKLIYSFDDEPENTQILEYNVKAYKGEYVSPFAGW